MSQESQPVGSLADEVAKFLRTLQGLAAERDQAASSLSGVLHEVNEHIATGAPECSYCPICQAISTVRGIDPEVRAHLASAATSLVQAVAGMLETRVPDSRNPDGSQTDEEPS